MSLELISTQDLVNELANRFNAIIIHAIRERDDDEDELFLDYRGAKATCIGLADIIIDIIRSDIWKEKEEEDE